MYILFTISLCKNQIENRIPKMLISRFKFILYDYSLTAVLFLKRRLLKIAKSPVL